MAKITSGKKYLVYGGQVKSKSDGDTHYISPSRVMQLYGVHPSECIVVNPSPDYNPLLGYTQDFLDTLKVLSPRYDGDYKL